MASLLPSAEWFGVNSLEEGLELRAHGITRPILLLGHVPLAELQAAVEADLRLTLYNRETVEKLAAFASPAHPARVHVKVDTGTSRQGVLPEDLEEFLRAVKGCRGVVIEGISTHYANIEDTLNHEFAEHADRAIRAMRSRPWTGRSGRPPYIHTACTAAALLFPSTHFTMLRSGIGLYGLWPSRETLVAAREKGGAVPDFRPVLTLEDADRAGRRPSPREATSATAVRIARCAGPFSACCPLAMRTATTGRWATARTCS